jgi:poly(beta-D-mannuronate) lyase
MASLNDQIQGKIDELRELLAELEDLAHGLDDDDQGSEPDEPGDDDEPDEEPPPATGAHPSDVLDLRHWTIMLPTGAQGDPDNRYVIGETIPNTLFVRYDVDSDDDGVVFRAPADGFHSPKSKYARCEAREMRDDDWTKAAWSSKGPRSLECDLAIDARGLTKRRRINGMQIHDGSDDICQIMRHESQGLGFMHNDGKSFLPIDPLYVDGTRFTCKITVQDNRIKVDYNGRRVVDVPKTGSGWYWKFGCYLQTGGASEHKEPASAFGEVVVYRYELT